MSFTGSKNKWHDEYAWANNKTYPKFARLPTQSMISIQPTHGSHSIVVVTETQGRWITKHILFTHQHKRLEWDTGLTYIKIKLCSSAWGSYFVVQRTIDWIILLSDTCTYMCSIYSAVVLTVTHIVCCQRWWAVSRTQVLCSPAHRHTLTHARTQTHTHT